MSPMGDHENPMSDHESLEAWADALLDQHRSDLDPDPPSPAPASWLMRDLPKVGAFMEAAQAIGFIILALIAFGAMVVAFNSG